jgi:hypothetical protein
MQIQNTAPGVRSILNLGLKIRPGQVVTVDDEAWAKAKGKGSVAHWLATGELGELSASQANEIVEAQAARDPLDHDGDGRKGGSKKGRAA